MTGPAKPLPAAGRSDFVTSELTRYAVQPPLIALMVAAQCAGMVALLEIMFPGQPWLPLSVLTFAVALVGVYGTNWVVLHGYFIISPVIDRIGEFVIVVAVVRVVAWQAFDTWPDLALLRAYVVDPLVFFDGRFVLMAMVTVFAWQRGLMIGELFCHMAIDESEARAYANAAKGTKQPITRDRAPLLNAYFRTWMWGGALLLLCAGATTFDLPNLARGDAVLRGDMVVALLAYAVIGFWLLSQGRLAVMNEHWMVFGMKTRAATSRGWQRSSLRLLLAVMVAAAFLPWGSTMPISDLLNTLLIGVFIVMQAMHALVTLAIAGLLALLGFGAPAGLDPTSVALPELVRVTEIEEGVQGPREGLLAGALFWLMVGIAAIAAVYFFLRDRGYMLDGAGLRRLWRVFVDGLLALLRGVANEVADIRIAIQAALGVDAGVTPSKSAPWRFIRVNALPPREQVRYFYLSILRHAAKRGVERRSHQTPLEYAADLGARWPDARDDAAALTAAFQVARYTRADIAAGDAGAARTIWKRLRAALKRRTPGEQPERAG